MGLLPYHKSLFAQPKMVDSVIINFLNDKIITPFRASKFYIIDTHFDCIYKRPSYYLLMYYFHPSIPYLLCTLLGTLQHMKITMLIFVLKCTCATA